MQKDNVKHKEQKEVRILIEKRYKNSQSKEVNGLITDTIQSVVKLLKVWKNETIIKGIYPVDKTKTVLCKKEEF